MNNQNQLLKLDPLQWKEYMTQIVRQQSEDIVVFGDVKVSLQKLQKSMTKKQIQKFFSQVKQMINHTINQRLVIRGLQQYIDEIYFMLCGYRLEYVPKIFLQAVTQSTRQDYFHPRCRFISFDKFPYLREVPLLQQISHIKFTNLIKLQVKKYFKINNAQVLTFIDAPNLKHLNIFGNQVTSLDVLYKANFPKLQKLQFYTNPIKNLQKLSRFHSKKLNGYFFTSCQRTILYQIEHKLLHSPLQNYQFLFKLESPICEIYDKIKNSLFNMRRRNPYRNEINETGTSIKFYESRMIKFKKQE